MKNLEDIQSKLDSLARVPVLLVASDYDGTIAPIVSEPSKAKPHREALIALRSICDLPRTHAAIISGRSLSDLAKLIGNPKDIHLVGSHGSEFDPGFASKLPRAMLKLKRELIQQMRKYTKGKRGFSIEEKPASVSLHYRGADQTVAAGIIKNILEGPANMPGVHLRHGKKVIELSVLSTHKGMALEKIRHRVGASAVLYFGDDRTDEDAFQSLRGPDLGIKISDGPSTAACRIDDTYEATKLLAYLTERRAEWLEGYEAEPIESHSLLSDQRSAALVSSRGRVVWCCLPYVDSNAIFAEMLGGPVAGYFAVTPLRDRSSPKQFYEKSSLELVTEWKNLRVTDYMDCSGGRTQQRAGRTELVRVLDGSGKVRIEFAPRLDFGRISTQLKLRSDGIEIEDTPDPIVLRSPQIRWHLRNEGVHQTAVAEINLRKNKPIILELRYGTANLKQAPIPEQERRRQTKQYWNVWRQGLEVPKLPPKMKNLVIRSALTIKAMCHGPSGGIVAAATTSLPEHLGGNRNWDYRFCWLRDAALSAHALAELGSYSEAMGFLDWVLNILDRVQEPDRLRPLYSTTGRFVGSEAEISELSGYAGSRPVRIGNAAAHQVQLDVFGPIVDLIWYLTERGAPLSASHWRLVEAMVLAVERRWQEPDHGIWEIRGARRHHVHSKVMCWLTVDRALKISEKFLQRTNPQWKKLKERIYKDILRKGWSKKYDSFTSAYGEPHIDASILHLGLSGLLSSKDPKWKKTVQRIEKELLEGPTVYRYRYDDGLPGVEGGFHLCTCWLIQSYLSLGRIKDAKKLFNKYLTLVGPTGLLSEEYNIKTKTGLGNHPQLYSHLGLIQSALQLHRSVS